MSWRYSRPGEYRHQGRVRGGRPGEQRKAELVQKLSQVLLLSNVEL
jgi:hypothetical protein